MEKILCSAVHIDNKTQHLHQPINIKTGFVICGRRHHNCFTSLAILDKEMSYKEKEHKITQGFLTDTDIFVNREQAYVIALASGQVKEKPRKIMTPNTSNDGDNWVEVERDPALISEDLW